MDTKSKECPICGSIMTNDGYSGDWKEYTCSDEGCSGSISVPASDPSGSGFSMEDLQSVAAFND